MPPRRNTQHQQQWRPHHYASAATTAIQALNLAHKCYAMLNVEKKVTEITVPTTSLTSTPTVIQLNVIKTADAISPPADSYLIRDGRTVRISRMDWEAQIRLGSEVTIPIHVDIYLVQGLNDDLIVPSAVFQSGTGTNQFRNLDMAQNFKILKKWQYNLSPNGQQIRSFDYHKVTSHKVIFDKDNHEGDSWAFGQLALILVSSTSVANNVILEQFNYRGRFLDN